MVVSRCVRVWDLKRSSSRALGAYQLLKLAHQPLEGSTIEGTQSVGEEIGAQ